MNLNSVKICFEAFVYESDISYTICNPIFSRPVANQSKISSNYISIFKRIDLFAESPDSGELKIVRMDKYSGHASGLH